MKYMIFLAFMNTLLCYSNASERDLEILVKAPEAIITEVNKNIIVQGCIF